MKNLTWFLFWLFLANVADAENFVFKYQQGAQYKALGTNHETVYLNGQLVGHTYNLNKITYHVEQVRNGSGLLVGTIQYTEDRDQGDDRPFHLSQEYEVNYWRDALGRYTMVKEDYVPVVRHVPTFPDRDLKPGDTWTAPGEEVHDLRQDFGIDKPMKIPVTVQYQYKGEVTKDGRKFQLVEIQENINARTGFNYANKVYPKVMAGWSKQKLYWDSEIGQPYAYEEEFDIAWQLSNGAVYEFTGTADASITEMPPMNRQSVTNDIKKDLRDRGLDTLDVKPTDKGVTITLDNIQFKPESDELQDTEKKKLDAIGDILKKYPKQDILVEGHTALAGTPEGRQKLSEDRAEAVGDYLLKHGVRSKPQILYKGWGSDKPIASNATEEGMKKNRRVEITILEN